MGFPTKKLITKVSQFILRSNQSYMAMNTLIVWKLDRLGRNLRHLINTVYETYPAKALVLKY